MKNTEELNEVLRGAQVAGDAVGPEPTVCLEHKAQPVAPGANATSVAPADQQPSTPFSEVVAEAARALGLSDAIASVVEDVLAPLEKGHLSHNVVKLIAQAIGRDEDLKNADAAGYLRGRNEKIEIVNRAAAEQTADEAKPAMFPRYAKRSFWDDFG